ncbi:tyrosine-type recombinase/integrase [Chloroflexota bacterium]
MENKISDHLNGGPKQDLGTFIQGYILNCRCEGKSPKTVSFYQGNLERFLWYCRHYDLPPSPKQITTDHLRQFLWYVASEPVRWGGCSNTGRRCASCSNIHYYHCLHIFFGWLVSEGFIPQNPVDHIKKPKTKKKVVQAIPPEEIKIFLDGCPTHTAFGCRNRAILMILFDSGLRVSELAACHLRLVILPLCMNCVSVANL